MQSQISLIVSCLLILLVQGCAARVPNDANETLYLAFEQYKFEANDNNIIHLAPKFFSGMLLKSGYTTDPEARKQLLFKDILNAEVSYFETAVQLEGCLSINGFDKENEPMILSLEYLRSGGRWLINDILVYYLEDASQFTGKATCPREYLDLFE